MEGIQIENKLEIAVIGAGAISKSHIDALTGMEDAQVTAEQEENDEYCICRISSWPYF